MRVRVRVLALVPVPVLVPVLVLVLVLVPVLVLVTVRAPESGPEPARLEAGTHRGHRRPRRTQPKHKTLPVPATVLAGLG